jgi:hypothetical protein
MDRLIFLDPHFAVVNQHGHKKGRDVDIQMQAEGFLLGACRPPDLENPKRLTSNLMKYDFIIRNNNVHIRIEMGMGIWRLHFAQLLRAWLDFIERKTVSFTLNKGWDIKLILNISFIFHVSQRCRSNGGKNGHMHVANKPQRCS